MSFDENREEETKNRHLNKGRIRLVLVKIEACSLDPSSGKLAETQTERLVFLRPTLPIHLAHVLINIYSRGKGRALIMASVCGLNSATYSRPGTIDGATRPSASVRPAGRFVPVHCCSHTLPSTTQISPTHEIHGTRFTTDVDQSRIHAEQS